MRRLLSWVLAGSACTASAPYTAPVSRTVPVAAPGRSADALAAFDGLPNGMVDLATHRADQAAFDEQEEGSPPGSARSTTPTPVATVTRTRSQEEGARSPSSAPATATPRGTSSSPRSASEAVRRRHQPDADRRQGHLPGRGVPRRRRPAASPRFGEHPRAAPLGERPRRRLRGGRSRRPAGGNRTLAVQPARARRLRDGDAGAGPRVAERGAHRALRWKSEHASVLSFAADAYLNEMGVTSALRPTDVTSVCDTVPDPEDHPDATGVTDLQRFARFIRATKAPPRDARVAATVEARTGSTLFETIGCAVCHAPTLTTSPAGTPLFGGPYRVPEALGSLTLHPYSDYLVHDVGTGDGIVLAVPEHHGPQFVGMQESFAASANRSAPRRSGASGPGAG